MSNDIHELLYRAGARLGGDNAWRITIGGGGFPLSPSEQELNRKGGAYLGSAMEALEEIADGYLEQLWNASAEQLAESYELRWLRDWLIEARPHLRPFKLPGFAEIVG